MSEVKMITVPNIKLYRCVDYGWLRNDKVIEDRLAREGTVLQWAIVRSRMLSGAPVVDVEATILDRNVYFKSSFDEKPKRKIKMPRCPVFLHIVPTGLRAAVGGSLGDAMPANLALAELGLVVTHPNTCNGGPVNLIESNPDRILYVEGFGLDKFAERKINLERVVDKAKRRGRTRKIGVVADCGPGNEKLMDKIYNAVWGFWSNGGANIVGLEFTEKPVGGRAFLNKSGSFGGEVRNWSEIRKAAEKLISKFGAEAIAPLTFIEVKKKDVDLYYLCKLPNPWGRDEALMSHPLVAHFGIPGAHAPQLLSGEERDAQNHGRVNPASGMEASVPFYTFSVLIGLKYAPSLVSSVHGADRDYLLSFDRVSAVICPATSMGGIPMLKAEEAGIPIIGVTQSDTVLRVRGRDLGFENSIEVETYLDALGLLKMTKKEGGEYTAKKMRELLKKYGKHLRELGERVCKEADVVPSTLLRPLVAPE